MKIKSLCLFLAGTAAMLALGGHALSQNGAPPAGYTVLAPEAVALKDAIDPLFETGNGPVVGETRALLVLRDGKLIAERYGPGFGPETRLLSWSIAKTVTAMLVGIMEGDGRLALDDPAPVAAWRQPGDPRGAITLRELMQMRAGLAHVEQGEEKEKSDSLRMLVGPGAPDQASYAEAKPLIHAPGSKFVYSSATTMILSRIVTDLLTQSRDPEVRREAMAQFMKTRLTGPVGLGSLVAEYDESGTMLGGAMMHMTARDFAKIGELMRNRGRVGDRQIVPERWIDFMISPSPANSSYGGQLWLNGNGRPNDLFPGEAPASVYGAIGYRGQFVIVSPTQRLTIVRIGITYDQDLPALRHALARVVQAAR